MSVMQVSYYGNRVERVTADGAHWREATPAELVTLLCDEPEHRVIVGPGPPVPAGKYADMYLPGHYPFLPGICVLLPVYAEVVCLESVSAK